MLESRKKAGKKYDELNFKISFYKAELEEYLFSKMYVKIICRILERFQAPL